jgi:TolB-like protein
MRGAMYSGEAFRERRIPLRPAHLVMLVALVVLGCAGGQQAVKPAEGPVATGMTIDKGVDKVAQEISGSLAPSRRPKIAVVDFLGPHDNHTQLGSFISEKLITRLFQSKRFDKVLERKLLQDLMVQQKIEMEGYFDQDTVQSVCGKIGIEAMVMGFIIDCGSRVEVNARLIDTNGEILGVAEAQIAKDHAVTSMLQDLKTATLTVAITPSNVEATVAVGDRMARCTDGIAVFRDFPQGKRGIVVTARGYEALHQSTYVNDDRIIAVSLTPKRATLSLRIFPPQGEILMDGETKGKASHGVMVLKDVRSGKHTVMARAEGYLPETRVLELYEDKSVAITLTADPLVTIANLKQDEPAFNIDIWTNKKRYRLGEEIRFYFRSDRDCYLTLVDYEPNGKVKVLFPNKFFQDNFVRGGKTYIIPGREYGFKLTIEPPTGTERIKAIATTDPLSLFDLDFSKGFFPPVERTNMRGMRGISVALDKLPKVGWAENTCSITIE